MAATVNFNLDSLNSLKNKIGELQKELTEINTSLKEKMDELQKDWQTPAGKEFFEKQKTSWEPEVKNYITILGTMETMIKETIQKYEEIESEADRLSINTR